LRRKKKRVQSCVCPTERDSKRWIADGITDIPEVKKLPSPPSDVIESAESVFHRNAVVLGV
jgi:hypothetical protein